MLKIDTTPTPIKVRVEGAVCSVVPETFDARTFVVFSTIDIVFTTTYIATPLKCF